MAETGGGRAHRCGDCAGCRRRNDGGCGRCLMCLKKRHGSDAQGRQSCADHWCSQMRAYDDKGPVQGLAGWSVIAIPRVADGEDYYYLSPVASSPWWCRACAVPIARCLRAAA